MRTIRYYYSSMSQQGFLVIFSLCMLARIIVFAEVQFLNIDGYADQYNLFASILLYTLIILAALFLLIGFRFFLTEFTEEEVTNVNKIFNKRKSINLSEVDHAVFTNKGIHLYKAGNEGKKGDFIIKFRKFGIASPVGVESFEKLLQYKEIPFTKEYETFPGLHKSKIIMIGYIILCLSLLVNSSQAIYLAIMLPFKI